MPRQITSRNHVAWVGQCVSLPPTHPFLSIDKFTFVFSEPQTRTSEAEQKQSKIDLRAMV